MGAAPFLNISWSWAINIIALTSDLMALSTSSNAKDGTVIIEDSGSVLRVLIFYFSCLGVARSLEENLPYYCKILSLGGILSCIPSLLEW